MKKKILGVNKNIFLLGIVSFLTDLSSEMIFSVFSIFFTVVLGASTILLGIVEGLADFAASSLDYISGFISDKTGKRKILTTTGYTFSTIAKTILLVPSSVLAASLFRIIERLGKSFRGPPRDSWLASLANKNNKGYSFGLHKALDKAGAVLGPLVAYLIINWMGQTDSTFGLIFIIALIPAIASVVLLTQIKEKEAEPLKKENIFKIYKKLNKKFKHYFYTTAIFSLAYFSFSFLLLKAYIIGFAIKDVVLLYALFNLAFVLTAIPIGKIGDKIGLKKIIAAEYILYLIMCIWFIFASTRIEIIILFILFGIFYAVDESQSKAYITNLEPNRKGTAIGVYNFATGLVYLPASIIAGLLWSINPNYAFLFAGLISIVSFVFFVKKK